PAAGGAPRLLTAALDRGVANPAWAPDGKAILFQLEDDRTVQLARVPAAGGAIQRLIGESRVVTSFTTAPSGRVAVAVSTLDAPAEVFGVGSAGNSLRPRPRQHAAGLQGAQLAPTDPLTSQ